LIAGFSIYFVERIKERYWEANKMNETIEKAYSPKEMSTTLDIGDSTLRKWCLALERNGYGFIRNDKNARLYVERDIVVLRHFQNLTNTNMPLNNAAALVVDRFGKGAFEVSTVPVPVENEIEEHRDFDRSEEIEELKEQVSQQSEVIGKLSDLVKDLVTRLDQQQKYNDERMKRLEENLSKRDDLLLETIQQSQKESQETKRLLLEAQTVAEEAKQVEEKKPRKGFMKWFSKE